MPDDGPPDDSQPADAPVRIFGNYEVLSVIARGGMGVVYRARHLSLDRVVALKLIRAGEFADEAGRKRFRAEAEAAAQLDHPNIVPVLEVGEHLGQAYFAMKLIEGGSLAQRLRAPGHSRAPGAVSDRYPASSMATLLAKISRAVHHAHKRGILHRDLKPSNILLDAQGEPFVTDFGLAKRLESGPDLTLTGAVLGTPDYMSPEQAAGRTREITTATDIFSLGAILYELLAGRPPFQADTPLATMRKVVEEEPVPPSRVRRGVASDQWSVISGQTSVHKRPSLLWSLNTGHWSLNTSPSATDRDLETICLKCLQKNPAHRYATAEALAQDLERWLRHEPIRARPSTAGERAVKWTRRHPARAGLLAVSAAAAVALMVLDLVYRRTLQGERDHAVQLGQQASAAATRAEAGELAARERAYAADLYAATQALAANDLAQARRLLAEHRPKGIASDEFRMTNGAVSPTRNLKLETRNSPDLRGFEWRALWERTRGQEVFAFTNLARPATCLVFAPDGRTLVSGDDDGVHLWDVAERRPLGLFPGPDPGKTDGDRAPTDEELRPMLQASPAVVEHLQVQPAIRDYLDAWGHTGRTRDVNSLAFTPDGKHLLVGSYDFARSWTFAARTFDFAVPENMSRVCTPGTGDFFVVANDQDCQPDDERRTAHPQSALVYSCSKRRLVAELPGYGFRAAISPDGGYIAATGRTNGIVLWHPATGKTVPLVLTPWANNLVSFSPDGRTLLVQSYTRTFLWDLPSQRIRADLSGAHRLVDAADWSPDGRTLATVGDQTIVLWSVPPAGATNGPAEDLPHLLPHTILQGHEASVAALAFSPDGRWLATAAADYSIRFWAIASAHATEAAPAATTFVVDQVAEWPFDAASGCVVGRVGGGVSGRLTGQLAVLEARPGSMPQPLAGTEKQFYAGCLAHGQGFVTVELGTNDVPVQFELRRLPDGAVRTHRKFLSVPEAVRLVDFGGNPSLSASPDGRWLALTQRDGGRARNLEVYDLRTGQFTAQLPEVQRSLVTRLRVSPDSRWLVRLDPANGDNWISVYDSRTWGPPRVIRFRSAGMDLDFASIDPASRRLATAGPDGNSLRIWDLLTGRLESQCASGGLQLSPVWSPDGRVLVAYSGGGSHFWSMVVFRELTAFPPNYRRVGIPLGFTPDGQTLVGFIGAGQVKTWSPPTLAEIDLLP